MGLIVELTQLSPTMSEGTFIKWSKKVGDSVEPGSVLAEVETDKAVMEMEAYDEGILLVQLANEGDRLPVGAPVAIIGDAGEVVADLIEEAKAKLAAIRSGSAPASAEEPAPEPKAAETAAPSPSASPGAIALAPATTAVTPPPSRSSGRILASPLARKIAEEKNIEISRVTGTGPGGRITKTDILNFVQTAPDIISFRSKPDQIVEITGMRKIIAQRLSDSKKNIPHFYLTLEFDAEPLFQMRSRLNADLKASDDQNELKISFNDLIVKAAAQSLSRHPAVNSSWRNDHIIEFGRVDIGIAVSMDGGLITPYVRNADQLPLSALAGRIRELSKKARERKLKPEEYTDGTFTISNLGMFGTTEFSAIINEPEAALLAVGGLVEKPVVKNGEIVPGKTMKVTLSCDHRVIDGAEGARFLETFRKFIENPHSLLV
ncbi:MAG: 2-oxo acid dehydrogenase subunit E2 [Spirochaetia bacterium]|nr:2-oxo acid dehydrogenase subunit E2 [Spirochaetia bacterium]